MPVVDQTAVLGLGLFLYITEVIYLKIMGLMWVVRE